MGSRRIWLAPRVRLRPRPHPVGQGAPPAPLRGPAGPRLVGPVRGGNPTPGRISGIDGAQEKRTSPTPAPAQVEGRPGHGVEILARAPVTPRGDGQGRLLSFLYGPGS